MKELIYSYMKVGLIHFMAYPCPGEVLSSLISQKENWSGLAGKEYLISAQ